uniref:hypothetical protein n=1 Tax=Sulfurovum sp. TaxID=1969726 RepID=UPI0025F7A58D
ETISKIGAIFLPPTVISGILGVNTIDFAKDSMTMYISGGLVILSALFGMGSISRSKILKVISAVLLAGTVAYALFCMPQQQTPSKKGENICHKTH